MRPVAFSRRQIGAFFAVGTEEKLRRRNCGMKWWRFAPAMAERYFTLARDCTELSDLRRITAGSRIPGNGRFERTQLELRVRCPGTPFDGSRTPSTVIKVAMSAHPFHG